MVFFKKFGIFAFVLLLYASLANAALFDISVEPVKDKILIDEFAKFKLIIKNNMQQADEYRIYSPDFPIWDVRTEPIVNPITLVVSPGGEGSVELVVDPLKIRDIGTYGVIVNIRSEAANQLKSVQLKVSILSVKGLIQGYVPTVVTSVGIPEKIDPREEIPIKIVLNNQNIINYTKLTIRLESNSIQDTINTSLEPEEEKTLMLTERIDPFAMPQEDELAVSVFSDDISIINPIVKKVEIMEYTDKELVSQKKNFLRTKTVYDFVSNNPYYEGKFRTETTLLESIFSSENPKARIAKENGKSYFVWNAKLENNRMRVTVTKNFIPLFAVIILLLVVIAAYYALRAPLVIRKEASSIVKSEGGVSEMSVILRVQNRGRTKIKDIEVTEIIPSIINIEREVSIGSLQPTKLLRHEKKGTTIVKWELNNLDVSEERVLSYRMKSKLSILGTFSLPAATAVFKANDKTFTTASNRLNVGN
ncbi:hypothetical protein HYU50_01430 [Candidatus Woesearchaeota archaeon]|nr:hypothetical protein [Candidatus Woesearchaeota archaeon]